LAVRSEEGNRERLQRVRDSAPVAEDAVTGEQAGKGSGEGLKRTGG